MIVSSDPAVTAALKDVTEANQQGIGELQKAVGSLPLRDVDRAQLTKMGELRTKVVDTRTRAPQTA